MALLSFHYGGLLLDGAGYATRRLSSRVHSWNKMGKYFHDWHLSVLPQPLIIVYRASATAFSLYLFQSQITVQQSFWEPSLWLGSTHRLSPSAQPIVLHFQTSQYSEVKGDVGISFSPQKRYDLFWGLEVSSSSLLLAMYIVNAEFLMSLKLGTALGFSRLQLPPVCRLITAGIYTWPACRVALA